MNHSSPIIKWISIVENNANGHGSGIYCKDSSPTIENVIISGNSASLFGGGFNCENSSPFLKNVAISFNNAGSNGGGLSSWNNSSPILKNVTISCNNATSNGGGIFIYSDSSPILENVTITGNSANDGGGIYCLRNSSPSLVNCILWDDLPQEIYFNESSEPNLILISYSDIQGGEEGIMTNSNGVIYWLEGNMDEDPLFADPFFGNYHLTENSPCIDAGDPNSPYDPDGTIADMGAFYYHQENETNNNEIQIIKFNLLNYPNPFNSTTTISFSIPEESKVEILIYNIKGQKVKQLIYDELSAGQHSVVWNGRDSNGKRTGSGIYFCNLKVNNITIDSKKMILMK